MTNAHQRMMGKTNRLKRTVSKMQSDDSNILPFSIRSSNMLYMPTQNERTHFTLWSAPSSPDVNSLEANGITDVMITRLSHAISAVQPSDISDRLKPFDTKLEEAANGRVVY